MSGPLTGVVIADFTQLAQGPFATQILGDMGADIIKIEPPKGDWMRTFALGNLYLQGESVSFLSFNRNKRSVAVNLKTADGLAVVRRVVERADVVIENFRPGVMDRLGIGYQALSAINPRLIYCASSGFGSRGPYVTRPGQDLLIQAMSGGMWLNGDYDDSPVPVGVGIADLVTTQHIVYAVTAALYARERTGRGQYVETNLYNALLALHIQELTTYLNSGVLQDRGRFQSVTPWVGAPYGVYRTVDGYLAIAMNPLNKLARLIGLEGFEDVDSQNVLEGRDEIRQDLARTFLTRTNDEWLQILLPEDIWCAPVYTFADVERDPQVAANEMIVGYDHPTAGMVRTVGIPVKFAGTPSVIARPAPRVGEHTVEILRDVCGYGPDEIRRLLEQGAVIGDQGND